jgi:hypothetical protein
MKIIPTSDAIKSQGAKLPRGIIMYLKDVGVVD